mgnify:CR=1 FL=1
MVKAYDVIAVPFALGADHDTVIVLVLLDTDGADGVDGAVVGMTALLFADTPLQPITL